MAFKTRIWKGRPGAAACRRHMPLPFAAIIGLGILAAVASAGAVLSGCAPAANAAEGDGRLTIVATNFPLYDFARAVVGERASVSLLLPPGMESHSYEPTPKDIIQIQNSGLFLMIGGESDAWVERVLDGMQPPPRMVLRLMDHAFTIQEETVEGMQHEGGAPDEQGYAEEYTYDEHIWTSPVNAIRMVEAIASAAMEADPQGAEEYARNVGLYIDELHALDDELRGITQAAGLHTIVFGDRYPFVYLSKEYGLTYYAAFPGCMEQTEPSASTVAFLIDKVKAEHIPVVFHIEMSNENMADAIAEATGAKKRLLHSCHNVTKQELEQGVTYISLMRQNAATLKEALGCR